MSMAALVLRKTAQKMLMGRTWAGSQVLDMPLDPITDFLRNGIMQAGKEVTPPMICIYTPDSESQIIGPGRDVDTSAKASVKVCFYIYVSPKITATPEENAYAFELDGRVSAMTLDLVSRQLAVELNAEPATNAWREIWRIFAHRANSVKRRSVLVQVEQGINIPCREIVYDYETVPEPYFGRLLSESPPGWQKFDAALRASGADDTMLADLVKEHIEMPEGLHDYQRFQADFSLTNSEHMATGEAPLATKESDGTVPILESVDVLESFVVRPRPLVTPWVPEFEWPDHVEDDEP